MKVVLDTARTSPLYGRQFHLQERQSSYENDKGLVGSLVAPRPDKYVGLDEVHVWNYEAYRGQYKCIGYDARNEAVGIETKVEVDVRG